MMEDQQRAVGLPSTHHEARHTHQRPFRKVQTALQGHGGGFQSSDTLFASELRQINGGERRGFVYPGVKLPPSHWRMMKVRSERVVMNEQALDGLFQQRGI